MVLVYVDPSPRGEWALAVTAQLPSERPVQLLATEEDVAHAPGLFARARERLGARDVTEVVRSGPAERAVVAQARARRYDLIVVPPAGRSAIARMIKGSRVATVVKSVGAPVLVARRPPPRIERLLVGVSGRASTESVIDAALGLERDLGARLSLLHVVSEVALPAGATAPPAAPPTAEAVRQALRRRGREEAFAQREGLIVEELLEEFDRGDFHLLVLGGAGEAGRGFGREDVTERLLLRCPGSTFIVPAS
jgi:nucleotide-binding universal stress UspA family protein